MAAKRLASGHVAWVRADPCFGRILGLGVTAVILLLSACSGPSGPSSQSDAYACCGACDGAGTCLPYLAVWDLVWSTLGDEERSPRGVLRFVTSRGGDIAEPELDGGCAVVWQLDGQPQPGSLGCVVDLESLLPPTLSPGMHFLSAEVPTVSDWQAWIAVASAGRVRAGQAVRWSGDCGCPYWELSECEEKSDAGSSALVWAPWWAVVARRHWFETGWHPTSVDSTVGTLYVDPDPWFLVWCCVVLCVGVLTAFLAPAKRAGGVARLATATGFRGGRSGEWRCLSLDSEELGQRAPFAARQLWFIRWLRFHRELEVSDPKGRVTRRRWLVPRVGTAILASDGVYVLVTASRLRELEAGALSVRWPRADFSLGSAVLLGVSKSLVGAGAGCGPLIAVWYLSGRWPELALRGPFVAASGLGLLLVAMVLWRVRGAVVGALAQARVLVPHRRGPDADPGSPDSRGGDGRGACASDANTPGENERDVGVGLGESDEGTSS